MTAHEDLRFRDLGPLAVERAGEPRLVVGARLESALALLLIHAGHLVGTDALSEAMWGDQGIRRSAKTVGSHIWRLRQLLEPDRAANSPPEVLIRESGGYRLTAPTQQIDSVRYAALAAEAGELLAAEEGARALDRAEEALALWRGRPYGVAADQQWARAAVARLEEIRGRLRETLIGALLGIGAPGRALEELEVALAEEPLRERLWAFRMIAYRDCGRRSDALATYAAARAVLVDELGIEPGPQLRALHAELLHDAPDDPIETAVRPAAVPAGAATDGSVSGLAPDLGEQQARQTLPTTRGRLLGREHDLDAVLGLLGSGRLVTLVGAAGCGKTRLAVEAARRVAAGYPDGVWFVDLTSASADRVVDTVSSTLEVPIGVSGSPVEALRQYTGSRRMLMVLDNCEHVLDAAAELVDALRLDPSGLSVLATSREPLEVDGEKVFGLAPLPPPAAVELFLERLDTPPPEESLPTVREIAAAVDGVPLALELAAGRARVYTLAEIASQVRADASSLSGVGRRRGNSHRRTVRDAIDSSYRALPAPLATLHRAIGAVPGPFTARLAAGLVGADVTDAIADLAHRSLLLPLGPAQPGGASRFAQLAMVRGHANHVAERADEDPATARNAWVQRLVNARPAMGSTRNVAWRRALDDDIAALRATLEDTLVGAPSAMGVALAARLGRYWAFSGMALEGERWMQTAADACAADPGLGRRVDRATLRVEVGTRKVVRGLVAPGREQIRAGIAEGEGVTGDDAVLLCTALAVAGGILARGDDGELLAELSAVTRRTAAGSAALDVAVRHVELAHATITKPGIELVPQYTALYRDARAEDNLYTAWLAAENAARLLLAADRATEAVAWARTAVRASAEAGQRSNVYVLEVYGMALGQIGSHAAALRVLGALESQQRTTSVALPGDHELAALVTALTSAVGAAAADKAREEGAHATMAELADA